MNNQIAEKTEYIEEKYIPTSIERRKAILTYLFVWVVLILSKRKTTVYEKFHLCQSLWRRVVFFIMIIGSIFLLLFPYLNIIPIVLIVTMMIVWSIFARQAWNWEYVDQKIWENVFMPFFYWLWTWIVEIFELEIEDNNQDN